MIVTVGTWRGGGATTTALLLAGAMSGETSTWLIEADPAGGVLGGRVHFESHEIGGLEQIAFNAEADTPSALFERVALRLGEVRVVGSPADPFRSYACHSPRTPWQAMLRDLDGDVVVDVGRIRAGTPAWSLVSAGDVLVLVLTPEVSAAVASSEWVMAGGRVAHDTNPLDDTVVRLAVVDMPGGIAFPRETLRAELGEHWGAWLPWEPETVDLVHRGATLGDRRLRRSALVDAARGLASTVRASLAMAS